jgi:hypothetical protein
VPSLEVAPERHAQDISETWQARVLAGADGKMQAVTLSVLAHSYDEVMPVLLRVVYPGFTTIIPPFYCSAARIVRSGQVVADLVTRDAQIVRNAYVFRDTRHMERMFRRLADKLRLSDDERVALFNAVKAWVVCDFRLDPTMNPADPEARRLVH